MDFENLDELKTLKARGVLSEAQFEQYKNLAARKILRDRKEEVRSKNAFVYMTLAYFTGTLGLHNFYIGRYKRGFIQLFLSLISFYMLYLPLLFVAVWALFEFLFVGHSANGMPLKGNRVIVWLCRLAGVLFLVFQAQKYGLILG